MNTRCFARVVFAQATHVPGRQEPRHVLRVRGMPRCVQTARSQQCAGRCAVVSADLELHVRAQETDEIHTTALASRSRPRCAAAEGRRDGCITAGRPFPNSTHPQLRARAQRPSTQRSARRAEHP